MVVNEVVLCGLPRFADQGNQWWEGQRVSKRRYVARGVPGGYRIWDNKGRRWWGDLYELCPDELLTELNNRADPDKITALMKRYRALKR